MKLKNILFIAIAILTIGLFVACNDEVVAAKDNNVAYTQVLESNGAFEYAGTKYETLQDAIEAIDKAKGIALKTIKVLKDVNSDGATVPATSSIILDLNGKTLSFLTSTGVTTNGDFYVEGEGEVTFAEGVTNGTAFVVNEGGELTVTNTTINVADQYAVKAAGEGATVTFGDKAAVAGNIAASDDADINLLSGSEVSGIMSTSGSGTVVQVFGKLEGNIAASDNAHIDLKSGSVVSGTMSTSGSGTVVQVFGTLEGNVDALNSSSIELSNSSSFTGNINVLSGASLSVGSATGETGPTIGDGSTFTVSGTNSSMTANKDAKKPELAMADGATVTVNDGGKIHITAFDNNSCTIICDDTQKAEIIEDADVNIDPKNITDGFFKVVQDDGQIKYFSVLQDAVNSAVATTNKKVTYVRNRLTTSGVSTDSTAEVLSDLTIDMNGNSDRVSIKVSGGTLTVENSSSTESTLVGNLGKGEAGNITIDNVTVGLTTDTVADAVNITGALISTRSTFNATVNAGTLTDGDSADLSKGSSFAKNVTVTNDVALYGSKLTNTDTAGIVKSTAGSITATGVTFGTLSSTTWTEGPDLITESTADGKGTVTITNGIGFAGGVSTEAKAVVINNSSEAAVAFATGAIESRIEEPTTYGNVSVYGKSKEAPVTVKYVVIGSGASQFNGSIYGNVVAITNAVVEGQIYANNGLDSENSVFNDSVYSSATIEDGVKSSASPYSYSKGSEFKVNITAVGSAEFYASKLQPTATATLEASVVEIYGATFATSDSAVYNITAEKTVTTLDSDSSEDTLIIKESTGYVGSLTANGNASYSVPSTETSYRYYSNIVVDNSSFTAASPAKTLSIGVVSSTDNASNAYFGDVTIKGGTTANTVTVSSISLANDVKTSYAVVTGNIGSTGTPVATVSDGWTDTSSYAGKSVFNGNIFASGAGSFKDSTFTPTSSVDRTLKAGTITVSGATFNTTGSTFLYILEATSVADENAISITSSTGEIKSLTAKAGSIVINNSGITPTTTNRLWVYREVSAKASSPSTTRYDVTINGSVSNSTYSVKLGGTVDADDFYADKVRFINDSTVDAGTVKVLNSSFSSSSNGRSIKASLADTNGKAIYIETSTGIVASLTASAGSIEVANSQAGSTLTVTGNVLARVASTTTTYYDVTLVGKIGANVVVNGTIDGNDLSLTRVTADGTVRAHDAGTYEGNITSNYSTFNSTVYADGFITDGNNEATASGSEFKGDITAVSNGSFYGSTFKPATAADKTLSANTLVIVGATFNSNSVNVYNLQATAAYSSESYAIFISSSNGSIGTVSASNAGNISIVSTTGVISNISLSATTSSTTAPSVGSIVINNSAFSEASTQAKTLSTGTISAWYAYKPTGETPTYTYSYVYGDVTVKGGTTANTVTVSSISLANNVKTSYAVVTGDIGSDTTKVKTVSDGWTDSSTVAGYSTFKGNIYASGAGTFNDSTFSASESDKTLTAGKVTINSGVFEKDNSDNRYYVVGSSSSYVDGVMINDSTGYLGAVTSYYGISINNDEATDDLFINSESGVYAVKANGYNIYITGPNASDKKIDITGKISGLNVYMYAGGTDFANDGSIVVHEVTNEEFYATGSVNIYGGTYGVGGSVLFNGDDLYDINIHKGVFYVSDSTESLKQVAEHIHSDTSYKVNIVLGGNIQLDSILNIGIYGGVRLNYNKEITFSSINNVARTIRVYTKYNTVASPVSVTYYDCYPVNLYSGEVVFDHVSLDYNTETPTQDTSISSNDLVVLKYCDSIYGSYKFVDANIRRGTAVGGLNP